MPRSLSIGLASFAATVLLLTAQHAIFAPPIF